MIRAIISITAIGVVWTLWPLTFIIPFWLFIFPSFLWVAWMWRSVSILPDDQVDAMLDAAEEKVRTRQKDQELIQDIGAEA
jgi:hypothetical protein